MATLNVRNQRYSEPDVWTNAGLNQAPAGAGQRGILGGGGDQILNALDSSMGRMGMSTPQRTQRDASNSRLNAGPGGTTQAGFDWTNPELPIYDGWNYPIFKDDGGVHMNEGHPLARYVTEDQWYEGDTVIGAGGPTAEPPQYAAMQAAWNAKQLEERGVTVPSMSGQAEQRQTVRQSQDFIGGLTGGNVGVTGGQGAVSGESPPGTFMYEQNGNSPGFLGKVAGMLGANQAMQQRAETPQEKTWAWQDYNRTLTGSSLGLGLFDEALDPLARLQQQLQGEFNPNFMNQMTGDQGFGRMIEQQQNPVINQLRGRAASMGVEGAYEGLITEQQRARQSLAAQAQAAYAPQAYQQQQQYQGATDQLLAAINQSEINAERLFATSGV